MASGASLERCEAQDLVALDRCATPSLVYTPSDGVIYVNRALRRLFNNESDLFVSSVHDLPVRWVGDSRQIFKELIQGSFESKPGQEFDIQARSRRLNHISCWLNFENEDSVPTVERLICVRGMSEDTSYRIISFEDTTKPSSICDQCRQKRINPTKTKPEALSAIHEQHLFEDKSSTGESDSIDLQRQFQALRDAVYYNQDRSGFLLSADGKFCFPHYKGQRDVQPERVNNLEEYFSTWEVWDPQFRERVPVSELPAIKLNRERRVFVNERYGIVEDGEKSILETTSRPLWHHKTGEYVGGVVWVHNLGPYEKVVLRELHSRLSDFQEICDQLPHICWTAGSDAHVDYFSQRWYDFTGLSKAESLENGFERAIHSEDLQPLYAEFAIAVTTKSPLDAKGRYLRHDGVYMWLSVVGRPLLDAAGNVLKWYGTMTEIEDLVAEGIAADKQKIRLEQMLAASEISLFRVDASWEFTMLQGKPLGTLASASDLFTVLQSMSPTGVPDFENNAKRIMDGEIDSVVFEYQLGERWQKCCLIGESEANTISATVVGILGCQLDTTDQHRNAALQIENNRLTAERLISIERARLTSEFLSHVSHEIRTPLVGVIGMSEMLKSTNIDTDQKDMVNNILTSASHLLNQVNDMLDLSRIENQSLKCEMVPFELSQLLKDTVRSFHRSAGKEHIQFMVFQKVSDDLEIVGDRVKIGQILSHILSNAVKFTSHGSISITISLNGSNVCFCIADTGIGITQEVRNRIFKPFAQGDSSTNRQYGGTGLGLTISRSLAEMMGGKLEIESEPGKGTTVCLTIPRTSPPSVVDRMQRLSLSNATTSPSLVPEDRTEIEIAANQDAWILIVEDNAINSRVVMHLVKKLGYQCVAAFNGQEALHYLQNCSENIALILMDCQMPIIDGYETTRLLRTDEQFQTWKHVPVVALTASTIKGDRDKCYEVGMNGYLSKPITYARFKETMARWLPERT